jgi:ribosomal protein L29
MARATGQAAKPHDFTRVRRDIARLKTVAGEQRRAAASTGTVASKTKGSK